jgi:DNA (cytosine-5)-methyltransferase 1
VRVNTFYEFFAGGGMARAGLGERWRCLFANEIDVKKTLSYRANWKGADVLEIADVAALEGAQLPGVADLVWASFPCQDLSLAGAGAGLRGERSGTFWSMWRLMQQLVVEGRAPALIVLENVCGMLTSHDGEDFAAICSEYHRAGYRYGALVVDAVHFVPQSRPRLFVVGVRADLEIPATLQAQAPSPLWHPRNLRAAYAKLPGESKENWVWWRLAPPADRTATLTSLLEHAPAGVAWHSPAQTARILQLMSPVNRAKVAEAQRLGRRMVGGVYRRTRRDEQGRRVQRAEVRFDDVAGCLRTPAGGSSRQVIVVVEGDLVRTRLISARETARLMGLPDEYELPSNYNEAYHLTGDGVVVPVVRHLAAEIFEPLLAAQTTPADLAA